jgi:hypothetical protein
MMMFSALPILLAVAMGGAGLPVGLPPTAEDPLMTKAAPEQCLYYMTWAGTAKPDAASTNKTEQLLADAEIQHFLKSVEKAIRAAALRQAGDEKSAKILAEEVPTLIKAALTRPGSLFVGKFGLGLDGIQVDGGMIVNCGDDTAELMKSTLRLESVLGDEVTEVEAGGHRWKSVQLPDGMPRLVWGFRGRYFLVGTGGESVVGILARARTPAPKWLTDLRGKMKVDRPSLFVYADVKKLTSLGSALTGNPMFATVMAALGFDNIDYFTSITGLDGEGLVTRSVIATPKAPTGLLALASGKPLTAKDLQPIPRDATLALAMRFDPEKAFGQTRSMIGKIDAGALAMFDSMVAEMKKEIGIALVEDILRPLGDTWCLYNSPGEGGLIVTGLTAVVSVRDEKRLAATLDKIQTLAQAEADAVLKRAKEREAADDGRGRFRGRRRSRYVTIKDFQASGHKVYFMNFVGEESPVAPAWCLANNQLVVALYPSHIKAYLARKADAPSIATRPDVAKQFAGKKGPVAFGYQDTREVLQVTYPLLQMLAQMGFSEAQREGFDLDISILPSAESIMRRAGKGVTSVTYSETGIEMVSRRNLPISTLSLWTNLPMMMAMWSGRGFSSREKIAPRAVARPAKRAAKIEIIEAEDDVKKE